MMPNVWVANGSSYIVGPTLGNILNNKVEVDCFVANIDSASTSGYLVGQAANTSANREFAVLFTGTGMQLVAGGLTRFLGSISSIFGTGVNSGQMYFVIDSLGAYELYVDGELKASGTRIWGTGRLEGIRFRVGARSATDIPDNTGATELIDQAKVGDVLVKVNDSVVAEYVMRPGGYTGSNVPNTVAADGTLFGGDFDGTDWESLSSASKGGLLGLGIGLGITI